MKNSLIFVLKFLFSVGMVFMAYISVAHWNDVDLLSLFLFLTLAPWLPSILKHIEGVL